MPADPRLRFICREVNDGAARNVGGPVDISYHTFTDATECAAWLHQDGAPKWALVARECIGVELLGERVEPAVSALVRHIEGDPEG